MKAKLTPIFALVWFVGSAIAQGNPVGQIRHVSVARTDAATRIEIELNMPSQPKVIVAKNPPRLVLEFENVVPGVEPTRLRVEQDGIKSIRAGLHNSRPPVTRVVLDLERERPYEVAVQGNRVLLTLLPPLVNSHSGSGAPGAAGVPLLGRFRGHRHTAPSLADKATPSPVPPAPASGPPLTIGSDSGSVLTTSSKQVTTPRPNASNPNRGSLQEGTVFPGAGEPGTGVVPSGGNVVGTIFQPVQSSSTPKPVGSAAASVITSVEVPKQKMASQPMPSATPAVPSGGSPGSTARAANSLSTSSQVEAGALAAKPGYTSTSDNPNHSETATTPPVNSAIALAPIAAEKADSQVPALTTRQPNADLRTAFKVKYVAEGAAYLDAGRSSGLSAGMKLEIHDTDPSVAQGETASEQGVRVVAQLKVISVAETSAVAEIIEPRRDIKPGDLAYLSTEDTESLVAQRSLSPTRKYPTVISFTDGDPLEEEAHDEVPRPPLPEVNRARGRLGFDYSGIVSHGAFASTSSNFGMVVRTDVTRIGGSYWNLDGYWRGRFMANSAANQPTLQDLINRTYTIGLTYDNPKSPWVAGVGRLYIPWATSLDTIDGGYVGHRVSSTATVALFAGSTPDPTSWSYAPDQQMSGLLVNFQGGSFDNLHYSSTSGLGIQMLKWKINRPFVFFENGLYYKRIFSLYSAVQADKPASNPVVMSPGAGVSRSFTTLRIQPWDRVEFDFNHTYFRDVPNFDPQLIGTGLLDKYLFQGFSAGPRVEVAKQIWVYATLGRSNRSGESKSSLNQLYGVTFGNLPFRFHADLRYSRFNSSFGDGDYKALSISRTFRDSFRWEVLLGQQSYASMLASKNKSNFVNANIEMPLGPHYFIQGGWTVNRGGALNYDQWFTTFGYRFDSWHRGAK